MPRILRLEISDTLYDRLMRKKTKDGFKGSTPSSWRRWLSTVCGDILLFPTLEKQCASAQGLLPMWMKSFSANLQDMWIDKELRFLIGAEVGKRTVVVGRGPSLFLMKHIQMLKQNREKITIVSTDGAYINLLSEGVVPDYVATVDGSDVCTKWFDSPLISSAADKTKVILCSQTSRKVVDLVKKQKLDVYWFHPATDMTSMPNSLTNALLYQTVSEAHPKGLLAKYCGGNIGTTSMVIAMDTLKSTDIALIGFDFSYPRDQPLSDSYYYDRAVEYEGYLNANTKYDQYHHPVFKTWALIDPVFKSYRDSMYETLEELPENISITNCTEGGVLNHRNMPCRKFQEWLEQ